MPLGKVSIRQRVARIKIHIVTGPQIKHICQILIFSMMQMTAISQTEFDSLKRNSMLDSSFQPSQKPTFVTEDVELKISGFLQPALYLDNNILFNNDLFITSQIPTTKLTDIRFNRFHLSGNQSRLSFDFRFPKAGKNISAFIEGDFFSSSTGLNTFFRLRHAYLTIGEFTIGQTWTAFGDINAAPNTLDLEGPNSKPSARVPLIQWRRQFAKHWKVIISAEDYKPDYRPLDSSQAVESLAPTLVFKPEYDFKNGHWSNSFLVKSIVYTDQSYSFKRRLFAWGYTSSLSLKLTPKKTLNVFGIIGSGSQGSVNDFSGLGFEALQKNDSTLETLMYYGGYISYSFVFKKRWSSTYVYSYLHQEKPIAINNYFHFSHYLAANIVYAINKYFTGGIEFLNGYKENYGGANGDAGRILAIMRLLF